MFIAVDVHLYDAIYAAQGLQIVVFFIALGITGYALFWRKQLTQTLKLLLWVLALVWVVCASGPYVYSLHTYLRDDRPLFKQENTNKG